MLSFLADAWAAYSFAATLIGGAGVLAVVAAFVLTPYLPPSIRHALFFGGALVIACAVYGQYEHARGAAAQAELNHTRALSAETTRADLAEKAARDIGAQAVRDAEDHERALAAKKESDHAADVHPDRDRVAVPRDLARGLRALQRSGAR